MPSRLPTIGTGKRARQPDDRPPPSKRGYGRAWRRLRAAILAREPLCRTCRGAGLIVEATDVDHDTALEAGGTNADENLVPLCHSCHSRKTAERDGGLGRAKKRGGRMLITVELSASDIRQAIAAYAGECRPDGKPTKLESVEIVRAVGSGGKLADQLRATVVLETLDLRGQLEPNDEGGNGQGFTFLPRPPEDEGEGGETDDRGGDRPS